VSLSKQHVGYQSNSQKRKADQRAPLPSVMDWSIRRYLTSFSQGFAALFFVSTTTPFDRVVTSEAAKVHFFLRGATFSVIAGIMRLNARLNLPMSAFRSSSRSFSSAARVSSLIDLRARVEVTPIK
jgi:hypothetical protein